MTTENKRMSQLIGSYADLDLSQLLNGEIALPTDHNPVYKDGDGNVKELLSGESAGYLENLIATMEAALAEIQTIIIERIGINDEAVNLTQGWSSSKLDGLFDTKQDVLTAGDNVQISADNVISATDTTYTAGTNVQISAENVISATDTTYTAGTNINIDANNQISCNVLNDTAASSTSTYSSTKIEQRISEIGGVSIDDTTASTTSVYSSSKTENLINTSLSNLKELLYPVGCIVQTTAYSTNAEMVAAYGGTTWALIEDRVLMGASSPSAASPTYTVGDTGGSDTITLTTANLPSHNHSYTKTSSVASHTLTTSEMPAHSHTPSGDSTPYFLCKRSQGQGAEGIADGVAASAVRNTNSVGGSGSHTHSINTTSSSTTSTGSGSAVSIVQSYYTVYTWTRTV